MNNKGMFYTNVNDYETKEDMMNDFIALRMYDMSKDKDIEKLNNIIKGLDNTIESLNEVIEHKDNIIKEVREYIEKSTQWYDKELGLVEMEGYNSNRIPVVYLYGLLEILDKVSNNEDN